jgi:uncharacterized protein YecE (DUF72 family)
MMAGVDGKANSLLRLGTSSFTAEGWEKSFYPTGMQSRDYLFYYATQFDTLEVDATFYRVPAVSTVKGWDAKTPADFLFALKTPQEITHERVLVDADSTMNEFLRVTEPLGEKLGVILLQFPYFNKKAFAGPTEFLARLKTFLEKLPSDRRFAVEIRNKFWLGPPLFDLLRKHNAALALIDHPWMPRPREWFTKGDAVTTDFTYIRWLGDRKGIEELTKTWDKTIVDRTRDLEDWVEACRNFMKRKIRVFAFANNHYGGYAPDTLRIFEKLMEKEKSQVVAGVTGKRGA